MASGSYKNSYGGSSTNPGYTVRTDWSSVATTSTRKSTITCTHYLVCGSGWDLGIGSRTNDCTVNGESKSFTSSSISTSGGTTHKLGTTTHTVEHDADGKKTVTANTTFSMAATISGSYVSTIKATGTMVLDDIPVASTLSANDGILGTSQKLTINKADSAFTHTITYKCGSASGTVPNATKTSADYVTWAPLLSLASQSPGLSTVTVVYTIDTYDGDDKIGSSTLSVDYTIPDSVIPSCSIAVSDPMGHATKYGAYVQNKSKLKVDITGTPAYSSPIKSYYATIDGTPYYTSSFTTDVIKDWGPISIEASVTDERGRTGTNAASVTVLEYKPPTIELIAGRANSDFTDNIEGEYIKIGYDWYATPLNDKNTISGTLKITNVNTGLVIEDTIDVTDGSGNKIYGAMGYLSLYTPDEDFFTNDASYIVEVSITDDFGTVREVASISSAFAFFHFDGPTSDGGGKNKLDLFKTPEDFTDYNGKITYAFSDNIYTMDGKNIAGYSGMAIYVVSNVNKGDTVRFNSVLLNPECRVLINAYKNETDSNGVYKTEISTALNYIDGVTVSTFEHTMSSDIFLFNVQFDLLNPDGKTNVTASFKEPIVTINEKDMKYEQFLTGKQPRLGIGKMAEIDNLADFGLKVRLNAGLQLPIIPANTDLNDVMIPNFYAGENITTYNYTNCPLASGTFDLEVMACGDAGQLRQKIRVCSKDNEFTYERFYYQDSWGAWVKKVDNADLTNTSAIVNTIYPVGSIYMSVNATDPKTLFGGTWERLKDRFLLAAGDSYAAGGTGGAATVALTVAQMPKHGHPQNYTSGSSGDTNRAVTGSSGGGTSGDNIHGSGQGSYMASQAGWSSASKLIVGTGRVGNGEAHDNMPPYLTVYMWKRTA